MSASQPHLLADDLLARPHQLCKCCQRLTGELVRVRLAEEEGNREVNPSCEHYNSLQDLIDGTLGNCHLCVIVCDSIQRNCHWHSKQLSSWLKSFDPQGPSVKEASVTKIVTHTQHYQDHIYVKVAIDTVQHDCSNNIVVRVLDSSTTPVIPYTETQLSTRNASEAHYHLIQKWLDTCTDNAQHPECNTPSGFQRPTRLIDLNYYHTSNGTVDQQDVRLVEGNSSPGKYAALSYCWGAGQQLKLLRTNLQQFQKQISWKELTQVSREAIVVCRRLSIPLLWIDALCIIQGEDGDFATEAPRMQDVYAGATLTIVAADSRDTSEAFLVQRNPLQWLDCTLAGQIESPASQRLEARASTAFCTFWERRNKPGLYHVDSRAWCLQERFMSSRSIFFGQMGIHWECRQGLAYEFDTNIRKDHDGAASIGGCLKVEAADLHQGKLDTPRVHRIWCGIVDAYSKMHLSHSEDVLIAIAGVSSIFGVQLNSRSTYGLWVDFLVTELLWWHERRGSPRQYQSSAKYLPSWSWASKHGTPVFMFKDTKSLDEAVDLYSANLISSPSDTGFEINFLQGPRDTRLCIRGYLSPHNGEHQECLYGQIIPGDGEHGFLGWHRYDRLDRGAPKTDRFRLLLICQHSRKTKVYSTYGLTLTLVNQGERLFRRAGYIAEHYYEKESPDTPASSSGQGKLPVSLWASRGEEQEVYIV